MTDPQKLAEEAYPYTETHNGINYRVHTNDYRREGFIAGYKKGGEEVVWKIIEGFQEMMTDEGLDRETEIHKKHLSYNDVEFYLYSLLPKPPKNTDNG